MINGGTMAGELITITAVIWRGVSNFYFDLWVVQMQETLNKINDRVVLNSGD
jgi:hypothetical protein